MASTHSKTLRYPKSLSLTVAVWIFQNFYKSIFKLCWENLLIPSQIIKVSNYSSYFFDKKVRGLQDSFHDVVDGSIFFWLFFEC